MRSINDRGDGGRASSSAALGGELLGEGLGEPRVVVAPVVERGGEAEKAAWRGGPAHDRHLDAPAVEEPSLEGIGPAPADIARRAVGQNDAGERADHLVRARRRGGGGGADKLSRLERECAIARHQRGPAAREQRAEILDRCRHRQPGGGIAGARPVELEVEAGAVGPRGVGAVADGEGADIGPAVPPHPEEGGALRRAEPLVAVPAVVRGAERAEVQRDHAGSVGPVDHDLHAAPGEVGDQPPDRQHERGRTRDVVQQGQARPRRDPRHHGVHDLGRRRDGERDPRDDDAGARPAGDEVEGVPAGVVGVVGREQLVAGPEGERAQHGVDTARGVDDEGEVIGVGADEGRQRPARGVEAIVQLAREKAHGLGFHLGPERRLMAEDLGRARAERAVVQEDHPALERPELRAVLSDHLGISGNPQRRATSTAWPVAALWATASVNSMYSTPSSKVVRETFSRPRIALTNSSSTRQPTRRSAGTGISRSSPSPRRPPQRRWASASSRSVPSLPKIHTSLGGASAVTELKRRWATAPRSSWARMSTWSGTRTSCQAPPASRRRGTATLVIAVTRRAGPSQRIIASYQMPMLRTLSPLSPASWRQRSGASRSRKRPCAAWSSTASTSPA